MIRSMNRPGDQSNIIHPSIVQRQKHVTILLIKRSFKIPEIKASCKAILTHFAG